MSNIPPDVQAEIDEMAARWAERCEGVVILLSQHEGNASDMAFQYRGGPYLARGMAGRFVSLLDQLAVVDAVSGMIRDRRDDDGVGGA